MVMAGYKLSERPWTTTNRKMKKENLLVVGPLPNEKHNCQWGGATTLMKNFCDYLRDNNVSHRFVQTNRFVNPKTLQLRPKANKVHFILSFMASLPWCHTVMFNFSDHGTVNMFPTLSRISKRMGKKVVLRKFGGSFDIYLKQVSSEKKRYAINAISEADIIFLETKASIYHMKTLIGDNNKIQWFPNVRNAAPQRKDPRQFSKKLVFMSHVSNEKGVGDMLRAFSQLPCDYELDIYGAIKEEYYKNFNWAAHRVRYRGEISSSEVLTKLPDYTLLLLPSSYREGYPGIIIEALSVGIPVISTTVGGIPELIENGKNGLLVKPSDAEGLTKAILSVNENNYNDFCENAYQSFCNHFESNKTNEHILSLLLQQ